MASTSWVRFRPSSPIRKPPCSPVATKLTLGCRSALSIWKLRTYSALARPWVIVPPGRRIERPGIVVTRAPLPSCDVRTKHGMRIASPPRAILDFAAIASDEYELESLVADGHFRRLAREHELRDQIERNPGRPGVPLLRQVLDVDGGPQRTRSDGERWLLARPPRATHPRLRGQCQDRRLGGRLPLAGAELLHRAGRMGWALVEAVVREGSSQVGGSEPRRPESDAAGISRRESETRQERSTKSRKCCGNRPTDQISEP